MSELLRSFGRDPGADTYGRHALITPGGDNRQVDVIRLVGTDGPIPINLNSVSPSYIGRHRVKYWDALIDGRHFGTVAR